MAVDPARHSAQLEARLGELASRIDRLVRKPEEVTDRFGSATRLVLRLLSYEPTIRSHELSALLERLPLDDDYAKNLHRSSVHAHLVRAVAELSRNVRAVERAQVVHGRIPLAYASWLWRLYSILQRLIRGERRQHARWLADKKHVIDLHAAPPLLAKAEQGVVHVGGIDPLIAMAEDETELLARRRGLLEAARELLLDASAALDLDPRAVAVRRNYIARSIAQIDRYEAAGLDARVSLTHQLRQAHTRGETQRLHASLTALEEFASVRGDSVLETRTGEALDRIWGRDDRLSHQARQRSLARSANESFDPRVVQSIAAGYDQAREAVEERARAGDLRGWELEAARAQVQSTAIAATLNAALGVDGSLDVGGVLTPARFLEATRHPRIVSFPTPDMLLTQAESPADLPHAVVEDPRTLLLSLAAGRLQARRFAADEVVHQERRALRSEVRIYVLDGSGSMLGPRAQVRDAILVAELATLIARLNDAERHVESVLYYRYFTRVLGELACVQNVEQALAAVTDVLSVVRDGGTDIELALLSSFEQIGRASSERSDLARAQVVLVTDGQSEVSLEKVLAARKAVGAIPVGVSIVALGEENPALRKLAAHQRAAGERVFYQYLSDSEIGHLVAGTIFSLPVHPPEGTAVPMDELADLVDEIEAYRRKSDAEVLASLEHRERALADVELSFAEGFTESERAHNEVLRRDLGALARRFERWFPEKCSASPVHRLPAASDREDLEHVATLLEAVGEVTLVVGGDPLARQANAIEILERLLRDAAIAPWRYAELVNRYPSELGSLSATVRRAAAYGQTPASGPRQTR